MGIIPVNEVVTKSSTHSELDWCVCVCVGVVCVTMCSDPRLERIVSSVREGVRDHAHLAAPTSVLLLVIQVRHMTSVYLLPW